MTHPLFGSTVALVTPFKDNGAIDYPSTEKLLEFHISNGTACILALGTTGEAMTLTEPEQSEFITFIKKYLNNRLPLMVGASSNSTKVAIDTTKRMTDLGADYILSAGPYYNKPTQTGYLKHFEAVAESTSIPIVLYNVPGRTSGNILPGTILKLSRIDNIIAVKEASGNMQQIMAILKNTSDHFFLLSGEDDLTLAMISLGAKGVVSVAADIIPKAMADLVHLGLTGEFDKAAAIHFRYLELLQGNFIESNPIPIKYGLSKMGLISENYRLPMTQMTAQNKIAYDLILKTCGVLHE